MEIAASRSARISLEASSEARLEVVLGATESLIRGIILTANFLFTQVCQDSTRSRTWLEQTNLLSCDAMSSKFHFSFTTACAKSFGEDVIAEYREVRTSRATWFACR